MEKYPIIESEDKTGRYGIKAYGKWFCTNSKRRFESYLMNWISDTEGSEQERAVKALSALWKGQPFTDSDL